MGNVLRWPRSVPSLPLQSETRERRGAARAPSSAQGDVVTPGLFARFATVGLFSLSLAVFAQEPGTKPETAAPPPPAPAKTASGHPADAYWTAHDKQLLTDFGWLARYKDANASLPAPQPDEKRVVFMGDSITEGWHFDRPDGSFAGKPYINRGISGQTSPQMLVRFRQDVVDLKPSVVVLLAGTNDIAGNTGPMTLEQTEDNLRGMAEIASANHIKVVLCSVLPAFDFPWQRGLDPAPKILTLNAWIKDYAAQNGYVYVDYHSAMKDERNGLPPNLSKDGVHPTPAGYAIMAPLAEAGIAKALGQ
ncbi:capsular biosynthesis protein [Acidobacteria bacterium AB60]|nr:capsular biosynthesis protein [Acidobacteria bacterium AB60]